jgi:hypothetical protein
MTNQPLLPCALLTASIGLVGCPGPQDLVPLPPPLPGQGFQLKTLPTSVEPGQEVQDCYFFRVPSDSEVFIQRMVLRQRQGSHHLNVFRVGTLLDLRGEDGEVVRGTNAPNSPCWKSSNWADWPLLVNSQISEPGKETVDFTLPPGVAQKLMPGELLMLQTHYVNATTQMTPSVGEAWINFESIPKAQVTAELGTYFATNQNLRICPGETKFVEKLCRFSHPATVIAANGHFHSRGTRFQMFPYDPQTGKGAPFYDSTSWSDPLMARGLTVPIPDQGGVIYRCEYTAPAEACGDPNQGCCFTFGPKVETSEHCNAFLYFYPRINNDYICF